MDSRLTYLLCVFLAAPAGAEEAPEWAHVDSGLIETSGLGPVRYVVGYSSVGYDHFLSEIVIAWNDGGERRQTIYEGIYDRPPATIRAEDGHLCVSMQVCPRGADRCRTDILAYRYDSGARRFRELEQGFAGCRR